MILFVYACGGGGGIGSNFETTESGLKFKFYAQNDTSNKIVPGVIVDYHLKVTNVTSDSVLENTFERKTPFQNFQFPVDSTKGDISEAMQMMSEGDSALFVVTSDTIRNLRSKAYDVAIEQVKSRGQVRMAQAGSDSIRMMIQNQINQQVTNYTMQKNTFLNNFPEGEEIQYLIKIVDVRTQEEIEQAKQELIAKEDQEIIKYLDEKGLEANKTESGLYIVIREEGDGPQPELGDRVMVDYVGQLMDGTLFDTSIKQIAVDRQEYNAQKRYQPFQFVIGARQVIVGWDEGIAQLKKGSKATLVVPSRLGYGPVSQGPKIPANSILVFDVDLIDVTKP